MIELDAIRERARPDLVIVTGKGHEDLQLWEHSLRVKTLADQISRLPDIPARALNQSVLTATALYHDAGWAVELAEGLATREEIGFKPTTHVQRELGASKMERRLCDILDPNALENASTCIRMLNDHSTDLLEAQIVSEADNLDEFGALCVWRAARKYAAEGKTLEHAIETWETQKQYGFWTARINHSLRFESVRQIARERLRVFDELVHMLSRHRAGSDIAEAIMEHSRSG